MYIFHVFRLILLVYWIHLVVVELACFQEVRPGDWDVVTAEDVAMYLVLRLYWINVPNNF